MKLVSPSITRWFLSFCLNAAAPATHAQQANVLFIAVDDPNQSVHTGTLCMIQRGGDIGYSYRTERFHPSDCRRLPATTLRGRKPG